MTEGGKLKNPPLYIGSVVKLNPRFYFRKLFAFFYATPVAGHLLAMRLILAKAVRWLNAFLLFLIVERARLA
jgi:hypothetical protein